MLRDFLHQIEPIKLKEPLAQTLGALSGDDAILEYSFIDAVKMAGHACPTVSGAYLSCQRALEKLYPGEIPVRGEIAVTVFGEPDDGVYGVMGQVFSLITGAAPNTGFKGLGPKFRRKDLLRYDGRKNDPQALQFEFRRVDNGKTVRVKYYPARIPFPAEKSERMGELMERVLWDAARPEELAEFQQLWMEKVRTMLIEKKDIDKWLQVEERNS